MFAIQQLFVHQRKQSMTLWKSFLDKHGLKTEQYIDYVCGVYDGETLVATGGVFKNIIKCLAIEEGYQGGEIFNLLVSHLMNQIDEMGFTAYYVYTKPEYKVSFEHLGFKTIEMVTKLVFLEKSMHGFEEFLKKLPIKMNPDENRSAIVMNANPFTLGHQYLVETASKSSDHVFVFVLSEDASEFSAKVRFELVRKGCAHLSNVTVMETSAYMVSQQTFPSYFLESDAYSTQVQACLDASIFKNSIAPRMGITTRFLGEEPFSPKTYIYNNALQKTLEPSVNVVIIPRLETQKGIVSATRVREALINGDMDFVKENVPRTTFEYLISKDGQLVIEKIKGGKLHEKL